MNNFRSHSILFLLRGWDRAGMGKVVKPKKVFKLFGSTFKKLQKLIPFDFSPPSFHSGKRRWLTRKGGRAPSPLQVGGLKAILKPLNTRMRKQLWSSSKKMGYLRSIFRRSKLILQTLQNVLLAERKEFKPLVRALCHIDATAVVLTFLALLFLWRIISKK